MALNCGIVGLPNVGKSTLFSALTRNQAEIANYPFCTIQPNIGIVEVPDARLAKITEFITPQKVIPAVVEFVDIAGLVRGASKGEGLGNQFLGNIRATGMVAHVVRCFEDADVIHVDGNVDPLRDISTIEIELCLSDLQAIEKRRDNAKKDRKKMTGAGAKSQEDLIKLLDSIYENLENEKPVRLMDLSEEDEALVKDLGLLTQKKVLYVCNVNEDDIHEGNKYVDIVREFAKKQGAECMVICAKIEHELALMDDDDRKEFQKELGMEESGLSVLIRTGYDLLGLKTYFTAGEKEVRAWTFKDGDRAPQAAGVIHTDFEKGFIRAQVYACNDLFELKNEKAIKDAGKFRTEGKDYVVQDGDVMHFLFNV